MAHVKLLPRAALVVHHFWRLDARRQSLGFDLAPLGYWDLIGYCHLTGHQFSPWETRMLELLDNENLRWYRNRQIVLSA